MRSTRTSLDLLKWFRKNKEALLATNYSSEFSPGRADDIIQSYAAVLARGGWIIRDASSLTYQKETIRGAIDRFIEYLIEQHGGRDVPPSSELAERVNTLGAVKMHLIYFQDIDPEDKEAIDMLNSLDQPSLPDSVEEHERTDFLRWQSDLQFKYHERAGRELKRLAADTTMTIKDRNSAI